MLPWPSLRGARPHLLLQVLQLRPLSSRLPLHPRLRLLWSSPRRPPKRASSCPTFGLVKRRSSTASKRLLASARTTKTSSRVRGKSSTSTSRKENSLAPIRSPTSGRFMGSRRKPWLDVFSIREELHRSNRRLVWSETLLIFARLLKPRGPPGPKRKRKPKQSGSANTKKKVS